MRGKLPGSPDVEKSESELFNELLYLVDREHTCPICETVFTSKSPKAAKMGTEGMDDDLRPRYRTLDAIKYRVVECPVCHFADIIRFFPDVRKRELSLLREGIVALDKDADLCGGAVSYPAAYHMFKSAMRCNLIRKANLSKRAYTALNTAWLLRGWRESLEKEGQTIGPSEPMSLEEEMKLIKHSARNFLEAERTEDFPLSGIDESTYDYLMAVLSHKINDNVAAERYVLKALRSSDLKRTLRPRAEDLRDELKKLKKAAP